MAEIKIAPSLLSADFARLGAQAAECEAGGADWLHLDVMDGRFVPQITIGPLIVEAVRRVTKIPLDVHLMIEDPEKHLDDFAQAGANTLTVHYEACPHLHRVLEKIKELGVKAGVAINPLTPASSLKEALDFADLVLVMTVDPGYGGQEFISGMDAKIAGMHRLLEERGSQSLLEVDGGIDPRTAPLAAGAGAKVLVAGTSIFGSPRGIAAGIQALRDSVRQVVPAP